MKEKKSCSCDNSTCSIDETETCANCGSDWPTDNAEVSHDAMENAPTKETPAETPVEPPKE